ncbi:MAG: hypothetical protein IJV14_06455 [Lachnospiraceae bacterium]|nr:hypothetical protein [Lachnospiraceae bacterium]
MPRVNYCRDPDQDQREILFGDKLQKVSIPALEEKTRIDAGTLRRYKSDPTKIPFGRLKKIVKVRNLSDEQILALFK